jgi:hypothetical protein
MQKVGERLLWHSLVRCDDPMHQGEKTRTIPKGCALQRKNHICKKCYLRVHNKLMPKTGINNPMFGKKHSLETRIKIKEKRTLQTISLKTRKKMSLNSGMRGRIGSLSPSWNPNLTPEDRMGRLYDEKYFRWINKVKKRDNYTCQVSGQKHNLISHHLNGWHWCKKERFYITNGITLSEDMHRLFHLIYGNKNNTKQQFNEFKIYIKEVLFVE